MHEKELVRKVIISTLADEWKDADIEIMRQNILLSCYDRSAEVSWVAKVNGIIQEGSNIIHI